MLNKGGAAGTGLSAPFPWFGGKARVASIVWDRFGDVPNYVEPFFGSGAVLLGRPHEPGIETVNDKDGFLCLAPETRLLAGDLRWVNAGDVAVGQQLIGFDENNGEPRPGFRAPERYRRWRLTRVTAVRRVVKPCYRLTLQDGTTVIASAEHLWLGGSHRTGGRGWRWQRTSSLITPRQGQSSWLLKLCDVQGQEQTWDAGWLGGFCDGEAHLKGGPGWAVSIHQRPGIEMDRAERIAGEHNFSIRRETREGKTPQGRLSTIDVLYVNGGMRETLRFLMLFRPERLLRKAITELQNKSLYGREHQAVQVVSKEFLGDLEVVAIETDCHTFVAEGLASHNCNFWRAVQHEPDTVAHWADWPVSESDLHARHVWLRERREALTPRLEGDPDYYDAKIAGWWVWGICSWIGSGWCDLATVGPWVIESDSDGHRRLVLQPNGGRGVNRQLVHLGDAGKGVNRKRVQLGNGGKGVNRQRDLVGWFEALASRLRRVRICCGDWARVLGPSPTTKLGVTGVFLDPPYSLSERDEGLYAEDGGDIAADVRRWAIEHGDNPDLRIALCGYSGEHNMPEGWQVYNWKADGGYGAQGNNRGRENAARERIWFSPHCLIGNQGRLWEDA